MIALACRITATLLIIICWTTGAKASNWGVRPWLTIKQLLSGLNPVVLLIMINNQPYGMPLAALFIGGVLPTVLSRLIIEHSWLYGIQFRMILSFILKKRRAELQAPSNKQRLTAGVGYDRINLERNNI